jgi:hypothetical protein
MFSSPLNCAPLPAFDRNDWDAINNAFKEAPPQALGQAWLPQPEPDFLPAYVRVGWRNEALFVLSDMADRRSFTRATKSNQRLWELGDTFEIFIRAAGQESYLEFHVAPNNLTLQLRFPTAAAVAQVRRTGSIEDFLMPGTVFQSKTRVQPDLGRWLVLAEIPAAVVGKKPDPLPGSEWLFSFCRYDYSVDPVPPVISSTSPHRAPDFHCQHEWRTMVFVSNG